MVVSNREPFVHERRPGGRIRVQSPAGGLTSALQPLMLASGGTWVAWGSGSADFEVTDPGDGIMVPPDEPAYRLRRLRLSGEEARGYYVETANRALWPLCHSQLHRFSYDEAHWRVYRRVNQRFALAALAEAAGRPATVWLHDYHLAFASGVLRGAPGLFVHQFWHIPWPAPDILRLLPVARELLRGLLGNHLLVFQTPRDRLNFLSGVRRYLPGAKVSASRGLVRVDGKSTVVRAHPISIDVEGFTRLAASSEVIQLARSLRHRYRPQRGQLLLGVDRIDYTKGIPRRFQALARLLEDDPALRGRVTLLQIAPPSRSTVPEYAGFEEEVVALAGEINARFRSARWAPIALVREHWDAPAVAACYGAADICIVSPLQDGMNLVAKEFVACQRLRPGVLVLSRFAGASAEMKGALPVNPYDIGAMAAAIRTALKMPGEERERRLRSMRSRLKANSIYDWMAAVFDDVARLRR